MDDLKAELNSLNHEINDLKEQIKKAQEEAEINIEDLQNQLASIKEDKRKYASKNDFESVQQLKSKESNLKFKIAAQWNHYNILKDKLFDLNKRKSELESEIQLEKDKLKRKNQIMRQMDEVLKHYKENRSLKKSAIAANIQYQTVEQWMEWGENSFNETSTYFYTKKLEIDDYFKREESLKLRRQMDDVVKHFKNTKSLEQAAELANVSYDNVRYWYDWGRNGFGEDNTYFYTEISKITTNIK